jgi:hypothetical protein
MQRYRDSGLTIKKFCAAEGVSPPSFYQWKRRLADVEPVAPAFISVTLASSSASPCKLILPGGATIELPAIASTAQLTTMIAAVIDATCRAAETQR